MLAGVDQLGWISAYSRISARIGAILTKFGRAPTIAAIFIASAPPALLVENALDGAELELGEEPVELLGRVSQVEIVAEARETADGEARLPWVQLPRVEVHDGRHRLPVVHSSNGRPDQRVGGRRK